MPGCFAICMSVCLFFRLSVCPSICLSGCLHVWLSVRCKSATQISFQFQFGFGKNTSFEQVVDFHSCHPAATPTATFTYVPTLPQLNHLFSPTSRESCELFRRLCDRNNTSCQSSKVAAYFNYRKLRWAFVGQKSLSLTFYMHKHASIYTTDICTVQGERWQRLISLSCANFNLFLEIFRDKTN